jgi:hypothetical protein
VARIFERRGARGPTVLVLPEAAFALLRHVVSELGEMIGASAPGPVTDRLFPRAYLDPTEEEAEREWQALVHDDLARGRIEAVAAVIADIDAARPAGRGLAEVALDGDAAETRWLTVLNDCRLALGTVLDAREDEPLEFPADDPRAASVEVYEFLGAVQDDLLAVLEGDLPEEGTEPDPLY